MDFLAQGRGSSRGCTLSAADFERLSRFISAECGIRMPPVKRTMLEARLQKRLRLLGLASFRAYCEYLFTPEGLANEMVTMLDLVTTNKTDFFREPAHFDYLLSTLLPAWSAAEGESRLFTAWSAGCSSGEEPYTLGMVLSEYRERNPGFDFRILATDISTAVLEKAQRAVYAEERAEGIPVPMQRKYLLRSRDPRKGQVRVVPELRAHVSFRRLNFMEADFGIRDRLDVIFCRNVMIYFDRNTQFALLQRFLRHLRPGGHLFVGHSETLSGFSLPVEPVAAAAYRYRR